MSVIKSTYRLKQEASRKLHEVRGKVHAPHSSIEKNVSSGIQQTFKFFCDSILVFKSLILFIVTLFSWMASWKLNKRHSVFKKEGVQGISLQAPQILFQPFLEG